MEKFREFAKVMESATKEAAKKREAAKASKIAEMQNIRDHFIPEVAQKMYYLLKGISPVLPGASYEYDNTLMIDSYDKEACIIIDDMQMTVYFKDSSDVTVEFSKGIDDDVMLSQQIRFLQAADAYLNENIDDIMVSALKWCKNINNADVDVAVDAKAESTYHVAIAM